MSAASFTRVLFCLLALFSASSAARAQQSGSAPNCGSEPLTIARMQWPSAAILAAIHAQILNRQYHCKTEVVPGDMRATATAMATTGHPVVAPELWLGRIAAIWNSAAATQNVRAATPSFSGAPMEAWFIPDYVQANNPALKSVRDLSTYWQNLAKKGEQRIKFISCPPDWACAVINRNLINALGLQNRVDIIEPANRLELDRLIGEAVSRHEPLLFYYWQPNAILAQFNFVPLDMGPFDATALTCLAQRACQNPRPSAFPAERIVIALAGELFATAPQIAAYFQRATMPIAEMNALLAFQSETGATPEQAALHFIETRPDIWQTWLGQ